jgi:predicted DNA-binding protein (UPF0251 family)
VLEINLMGAIFMDNQILWTKTILSVYRYLERVCNAIDTICMQSALESGNILGSNFHNNNALAISQKLIDLSERKVSLINLKILTEEILKKLDEKDAKMLILVYCDGTKRREIADKCNISLRTVFRRIESAEQSFAKKLVCKGYNAFTLAKMLKDEAWIKSVYDRYCQKGTEEFSLSSIFLEKAASM